MENEIVFPIGSILKYVLVEEDKESGGKELYLDRVQFVFDNSSIILTPIADTDEIDIQVFAGQQLKDVPYSYKQEDKDVYLHYLIGKKLQSIWVCENNQEYQDQVIFAFDSMLPTIAFVVEGSVINVFSYEQMRNKKVSENEVKTIKYSALK